MGEKGDTKRILRFQVVQVMIPLTRTRKTGKEAAVQGMEEPEASTVVPSFEKPALSSVKRDQAQAAARGGYSSSG